MPELTPGQRIRALQELSAMSDALGKLDKKCNAAEDAYTATYRLAKVDPAKRERLAQKWKQAIQVLQAAYDKTVAYSKEMGITVLPVPSGLTQRGARSVNIKEQQVIKSAIKASGWQGLYRSIHQAGSVGLDMKNAAAAARRWWQMAILIAQDDPESKNNPAWSNLRLLLTRHKDFETGREVGAWITALSNVVGRLMVASPKKSAGQKADSPFRQDYIKVGDLIQHAGDRQLKGRVIKKTWQYGKPIFVIGKNRWIADGYAERIKSYGAQKADAPASLLRDIVALIPLVQTGKPRPPYAKFEVLYNRAGMLAQQAQQQGQDDAYGYLRQAYSLLENAMEISQDTARASRTIVEYLVLAAQRIKRVIRLNAGG